MFLEYLREIVEVVVQLGLIETLLISCLIMLGLLLYKVIRHILTELRTLKDTITKLKKDVDACHIARRKLQERTAQQERRIIAGLAREDLLSHLIKELKNIDD